MTNKPDQGIKNVVIKKDFLKKVTTENATVVRFRVVSEDKNRKSPYSQIFVTESNKVLLGTGDTNPIGKTVFVNWSNSVLDTKKETLYDIFIGFNSATPTYKTTTNLQNYSFLKDANQSVKVIIQVSSINPVINTKLKIYDSGSISLV